MERERTDDQSRQMVLRDASSPGRDDIATWGDFWIFVAISAGIVITVIGSGLLLVGLWELI